MTYFNIKSSPFSYSIETAVPKLHHSMNLFIPETSTQCPTQNISPSAKSFLLILLDAHFTWLITLQLNLYIMLLFLLKGKKIKLYIEQCKRNGLQKVTLLLNNQTEQHHTIILSELDLQ
jgi:hypothetical protein